MSKIISYKGNLPIGEQDRIRLKTNNGKTGYKIVKFQIVPEAIFTTDYETVCQIFNKDQTGSTTNEIDFTNSDLLAVAVQKSESSSSAGPFGGEVIIFDNKKFNQDIFVTMASAGSFTNPVNYYIELEAMPLSDLESTMLTLQNLRTIAS
tara:strand:+ start:97 stop:546 length:450 start_codon:yes stop_codon:yes gene_type:complete